VCGDTGGPAPWLGGRPGGGGSPSSPPGRDPLALPSATGAPRDPGARPEKL